MTDPLTLNDLDLSYAGIDGMDVAVHEERITLRLANVGLPGRNDPIFERDDGVLVSFTGVRFFRGIRDESGPAAVVLTSLEEMDPKAISGLTWPGNDRFILDFGWAKAAELSEVGGPPLASYHAFRLSCSLYTAEWLAATYTISLPSAQPNDR